MKPLADFSQLKAVKIKQLQRFILHFSEIFESALQPVEIDLRTNLSLYIGISYQCPLKIIRLDVRPQIKSSTR